MTYIIPRTRENSLTIHESPFDLVDGKLVQKPQRKRVRRKIIDTPKSDTTEKKDLSDDEN